MNPHRVRSALEFLLPAGVAVAVWEGDDVPALFEEEAASIRRAVEKRRVEFARGRACARAALAELGAAPGALPVGDRRQPLWPEGFVGSITHCTGLVAAAAARVDVVAALGIDAEPARPLPADAAPAVVSASEARQEGPPALVGTVLFSAKESIHKALFPYEGAWLDPLDVEVTLGVDSFAARPSGRSTAPKTHVTGLVGRFAVSEGFVMTACHLPGPAAVAP